MTTKNNNYQFSQEHELITPQSMKAYPISCSEWGDLKKRVSRISDDASWYLSFGFLFAGVFFSILINIFTGSYETISPKDPPTKLIVASAFAAVCFIAAILCFVFCGRQKKSTHEKASDIVSYMDAIEQRFKPQ